MEIIDIKERVEKQGGFAISPTKFGLVEPDTELKNMLVEYVGKEKNPENKEVTVDMIVEVVAKEFPEFILVLAEENFFRGYTQAIDDLNYGTDKIEKLNKETIKLEKRKYCKLCEEPK